MGVIPERNVRLHTCLQSTHTSIPRIEAFNIHISIWHIVHIHTYVCISKKYVRACVCTYVRTCVCVCASMYVCVRVCSFTNVLSILCLSTAFHSPDPPSSFLPPPLSSAISSYCSLRSAMVTTGWRGTSLMMPSAACVTSPAVPRSVLPVRSVDGVEGW